MKVIMALHMKHWENMVNGIKKFEFRRRGNLQISEIYIYLTAPIQKIVGKLMVKPIKASLSQLWDQTKKYPGISYQEFLKYFGEKSEGYAFEILNLEKFIPKIDLCNLSDWTIPQSYRKLHTSETDFFDRRAN